MKKNQPDKRRKHCNRRIVIEQKNYDVNSLFLDSRKYKRRTAFKKKRLLSQRRLPVFQSKNRTFLGNSARLISTLYLKVLTLFLKLFAFCLKYVTFTCDIKLPQFHLTSRQCTSKFRHFIQKHLPVFITTLICDVL